MFEFTIQTSSHCQLIDITAQVASACKKAGVTEGLCCVFVPHTTAGLLINENADPAVARDILEGLEKIVPRKASYYTHAEGNSSSHIKASLVGHSLFLLLEQGSLQLGTWQGIYLAEFDGPRQRQVWVKVMPEARTS